VHLLILLVVVVATTVTLVLLLLLLFVVALVIVDHIGALQVSVQRLELCQADQVTDHQQVALQAHRQLHGLATEPRHAAQFAVNAHVHLLQLLLQVSVEECVLGRQGLQLRHQLLDLFLLGGEDPEGAQVLDVLDNLGQSTVKRGVEEPALAILAQRVLSLSHGAR